MASPTSPAKKSSKDAAKQGAALQYWAFTWNAPTAEDTTGLIPSDALALFLTELSSRIGARWVFQHERASRDHYQGRLDLGDKANRKTKSTLLKLFSVCGDVKQLTFMPESNNSVAGDGLLFYTTKTETRVAGPWTDPSFVKPQRVEVYDGSDVICIHDNPTLWQRAVLEMLGAWEGETWVWKKADDRRVTWIYNEAGNAGKSCFFKYLEWKHPDVEGVPLGTATQIKTYVADDKAKRAYLLDLPRCQGTQESQRDVFSALEAIKGGNVKSAMYGKKHKLFMKPPHVLVISNDVPDLGLCSKDRWEIFSLAGLNEPLVPMTQAQVRAIKSRKRSRAEANLDSDSDEDVATATLSNVQAFASAQVGLGHSGDANPLSLKPKQGPSHENKARKLLWEQNERPMGPSWPEAYEEDGEARWNDTVSYAECMESL